MRARWTTSSTSSVQPGRRTCRSSAGQSLGALKNRDWISVLIGNGSSLFRPKLSNRGASACRSDLGNVFIFLRRVTAYADCADHFAFKFYGNTALQRRRTWQSQRGYPTITDLIFKHLAWAAENRRRPGFADPDFHTRHLCIVEPLEQQQMTAVVNDNNHHGGTAFFRFRFRYRGDLLCNFKRQHFLHRQLRFRCVSEDHR